METEKLDYNKKAFEEKTRQLENKFDVVIVGSGIAGLYAAINLYENLKVLLISKKNLTLCNSSLAQGGVAAVYSSDDSPKLHYDDTCIAGGNTNDPEALSILVNQGPKEVQRLMELGVDFDKNNAGDIHLTLEGGHSRHRIFH
ncbi:MAG: FAD-dependent oxidoreductase, partial [Oscillospiraceae bacterium]